MAKSNTAAVRQVVFTVAVTPDDDNDLPQGPARSILVAEEGTVAVVYANGVEDDPFLAAGVFHPLAQIVRIKATGTTASGIKACY